MKKNLDKIIIAIAVFLIRYIDELVRSSQQRKGTNTNQPKYERLDQEDDSLSTSHETRPLLRPVQAKVADTQTLQRPLTDIPPSTHRKMMVTTPYPGIKKLVLPTQEQNPYKLYQAASPKQTHQLNYLLSKYSTTQQAIIMHEVLTPKTQNL